MNVIGFQEDKVAAQQAQPSVQSPAEPQPGPSSITEQSGPQQDPAIQSNPKLSRDDILLREFIQLIM